ncbi:MAG: S1C family serine protease [Candidatus Dormibacteria bacterium]
MTGTPASTPPPSAAEASAPAPLVQPGLRVRLLASVVLAALLGVIGGGAAAWVIYQHFGPVQRIVNEQINGSPNGSGQTVGQLAQAHAASVVSIATQPLTPAGLAAGTSTLADGVVVSANGLILTSASAVAGASQLRVGLANGQGYDAVIAGLDAAHGLAVLRIFGASNLTPLTLATTAPAVGDQAVALSRPLSGGLSVRVGTVSSVGLTVTTDTATGASVQDAISIDATAEPGADGAPVLNSAGNLIGVLMTVTQAPAPPGLTVLSLSAASALIATASGVTTTPQGTFGAQVTYIDPAIAAAAGLTATSGALIDSVSAGGPAAIAGLQSGDIVISVNGTPVSPAQPFEPAGLGLGPGDTAEVSLVRGAMTTTVAVTVGTAS